jgi:acyl-CoA synthetase (AMP-forming)/AMP-acid ligase II
MAECPVLEAYGMTEASHQISSNPLPPAPRLPGSVGIPTGTEILILDRAGRRLPLGEEGEVAVRGPGITPGYLNNPAANEESFFDGWFKTGDLGRLNDDGYLILTGRLKEMIIRGGENISPYEIESVLLSHPAVSEAACFAVPDDKYGEEVAAVVVLCDDVDLPELRAFCRDHLAAFKVPKIINRVDSIPRTSTGKVQRARIATELSKGRS